MSTLRRSCLPLLLAVVAAIAVPDRLDAAVLAAADPPPSTISPLTWSSGALLAVRLAEDPAARGLMPKSTPELDGAAGASLVLLPLLAGLLLASAATPGTRSSLRSSPRRPRSPPAPQLSIA
jgi:hypothetical protein